MRKKSVNTLLVFGVVVAIILLMIWLFPVSYTHLTLPTTSRV